MSTFYNKLKFSLLATGVVFNSMTTLAFQLTEQPYYISLPEFSHIRPQVSARAINYKIWPGDNKPAATFYTPQAKSFIGVGVHLFDLDVSLNLPVNKVEGKKNLDLQARISSRRWGLDAMWQRYRSFSDDVLLNDASLKHTMLQAYYLFDFRKFSLRAITNQSERQLRSAGSPVLHTVYSKLGVENPNGLFTNFPSEYGPYEASMKYGHHMWGLMPGYTYTVVEDIWIMNATAAYGLAHYWEYYSEPGIDQRDINIHGIYFLGSYLGFDKENYFAGLHVEYRRFRSGSNQISNRLTYYSIRVAFGIRFAEKGPLRKGIYDIFSRKQ